MTPADDKKTNLLQDKVTPLKDLSARRFSAATTLAHSARIPVNAIT